MEHRKLGATGPMTSAIGLGCMGMSGAYGPADRDEAISTIHAALDAGVTLLDTGDFYGQGHNEMLIGDAIAGLPRDAYQLSVKYGGLRDPAGAFIGFDASPRSTKNFLHYTLQRLRVDHIDIYRPARLDPDVPIEETIGAIAEMVQAGYVRHIGLSEMGSETIRRAAAVHPIVDLQIEYGLISRGPEDSIFPTLRELGIGVTAYGVLSRGLISGHWQASSSAQPGDFRAHSPRFQAGNVEANLQIADRLKEIADGKGITTAQLAIAWVAAKGRDIVPLIGAKTRTRLQEALGALGVTLSAEDLEAIETAVPRDAVRGDRYPAHGMASLDSERG